MADLFAECFQHLKNAVGLSQIPKESWSEEDHKILRAARAFIDRNREVAVESKGEETSLEVALPPPPTRLPDYPEASSEVRGKRDTFKKGPENSS